MCFARCADYFGLVALIVSAAIARCLTSGLAGVADVVGRPAGEASCNRQAPLTYPLLLLD